MKKTIYTLSVFALMLSASACGNGNRNAVTDSNSENTLCEIAANENNSTMENELEESARAFVNDFYSYAIPKIMGMEYFYDEMFKRYFTPEFAHLYDIVTENTDGEGPGLIDSEIISKSQDPDIDKAVIKKVKLYKDFNGKIFASVKIIFKSNIYDDKPIQLQLTKTSDGWAISDYDDLMDSMSDYEKEELQGLKSKQ